MATVRWTCRKMSAPKIACGIREKRPTRRARKNRISEAPHNTRFRRLSAALRVLIHRRSIADCPAVINPDREQTEKAGGEISGWSVEVIHARFNNTKAQDVWVSTADKGNGAVQHGALITRREQWMHHPVSRTGAAPPGRPAPPAISSDSWAHQDSRRDGQGAAAVQPTRIHPWADRRSQTECPKS